MWNWTFFNIFCSVTLHNVKIYHHDSNFDDLMEVLENELTMSGCLAGIYHFPSRYVYKNIDKSPLMRKKPIEGQEWRIIIKSTGLICYTYWITVLLRRQKVRKFPIVCTYKDYLIKLVLSVFLEIFEFFCYVLCGPFAPWSLYNMTMDLYIFQVGLVIFIFVTP